MADIEPPREGSIPGVPVRRKDVPRLPLLEENERLCRQLAGAVEDRDKLAAYLRWRITPHGPAPMTLEERDALLDRLGANIEHGASGPTRPRGAVGMAVIERRCSIGRPCATAQEMQSAQLQDQRELEQLESERDSLTSQLAGAVEALLAAPMPERESIHKGEEWAERYGDWWDEHVPPHLGGQ